MVIPHFKDSRRLAFIRQNPPTFKAAHARMTLPWLAFLAVALTTVDPIYNIRYSSAGGQMPCPPTRPKSRTASSAIDVQASISCSNRVVNTFIGGHQPAWLTKASGQQSAPRPAVVPRRPKVHNTKRGSVRTKKITVPVLAPTMEDCPSPREGLPASQGSMDQQQPVIDTLR